jgi:hypothetical protein
LRETGVATDLMDYLHETAFTLDEIHEFSTDFFVCKNFDMQLTNSNHDIDVFIADLGPNFKRVKLAWCVVYFHLTT